MNNKKALIHLDDLCVGILKIAEKIPFQESVLLSLMK